MAETTRAILHARQLTRLSVWRLPAHLRKRSNICICRLNYILQCYDNSEFYEALAVENNSISCVKSYRYNETSSMYTLYNMREHIDSPFILLESDLLYDPSLIKTLQQLTKEDAILMSGKTNSGDEVYIETDDSSNLVALSKRKEDLLQTQSQAWTLGIWKVQSIIQVP